MTEQENHRLKYQNQKLEKDNEDIKKMLSTKNEEIYRLKDHNQYLEDKIKRSKNNDLEEDIKRLKKIIMDKDDELAQIQIKLKS